MEILAVLALAFLGWLGWQLYRAKQFNQFKLMIQQELAPKVRAKLVIVLEESRSELTPNTEAHIEASQVFWTIHPARTIQAAFHFNVIDKSWLEETGNMRLCQHLMAIDSDKLADIKELEESHK
ncbi:hypothetical protein ACFSJY_00880 [Thalassotalea euphylliae]|uniref:hypothetical protein n=1 Tax=Thalassotalea euphylliae TaxID=1655234 RepID=UPI0036302457